MESRGAVRHQKTYHSQLRVVAYGMWLEQSLVSSVYTAYHIIKSVHFSHCP